MTPHQIRLVRDSFELVAPIADTAATLFYDRLFTLDPSLRSLFKSDMAAQRAKLMHVLGIAVRGLDNLEQLVPVVEHLGRQHVRYGVLDAHYATVGEALLWTLEAGLGEAFTPDVREAWTAVYGVLSTTMRNAANASTDASAAITNDLRSAA